MFYPLVVSLFSLTSNLAQSTSFYPVALPNRVDDAPIVIHGTVIRSQPEWSMGRDGKKRIYTFTEVQVDDVLKGNLNDKVITVKELGGEKDGIGLEIPGTAKFSPGEDIVLFLNSKDPDQAFEVRGMSTGKFMVKRDENGKEYIETSVETKHEISHGHEHEEGGKIRRYTFDEIKELAKRNPTTPPSDNQNQTSPAASAKPVATPPASDQNTSVSNEEKKTESEPEPALKQGSSISLWVVGIFFTVLVFWLVRRGKK